MDRPDEVESLLTATPCMRLYIVLKLPVSRDTCTDKQTHRHTETYTHTPHHSS